MGSFDDKLNQYYGQLQDCPALEPLKKAAFVIVEKLTRQGMTLKDVFQLSEQRMESVYARAYRLYQAGQYEGAMQVFRFLSLLDPTSSRYWLGMAASLQRQERYPESIMLYHLSAFANPHDPMPYFYMSDCYNKLNLQGASIQSLQLCIELCQGKLQYARIANRAQFMLQEIEG